ncbi:MAG: hypothetical protein HY958_04865, partial [Bacteroidia bacterium]|nr:hypothetical protein [Bacteroidia bacterium]
MKYFFSIYFFIISSLCFSQWFWQNPLPTGNNLISIKFINSNTGIAVGNEGTIIKTTDGGATWRIIETKKNYDLYDVCFPATNTGYAAGSAGTILKTSDKGDTWTALPGIPGEYLKSVFFTNENSGFVSDYQNTV